MVKGNKSVVELLEKYKNDELQGLEGGTRTRSSGEFGEQILSELMIEDAKLAAEGKIKSYSYDDIF